MFSKRTAIVASFSMLLSSSAFAADILSPVPEVTPIFSWTGAYVGLNIGFGGGKAKHPFDVYGYDEGERIDVMDGSLDLTSSGFLGGVQVGYNYQVDQWVLGVETDFQGANIKGEASASFDTPFGSIDASAGTKLDWYGTIRARAGVLATDRFLVYATGGAAYGRTKSFIRADELDIDESVSRTKWGWTVGAGAEYAITNNVTFKTEYLYTDLGKANLFDDEFLGANASLDRKFNFHTVRVGINYKF